VKDTVPVGLGVGFGVVDRTGVGVDDGRGVAIGCGDVVGSALADDGEVGVGPEDVSDGDASAGPVLGSLATGLLKDEFVEPPLRLFITSTKPPPPHSSTTTAMASSNF
jgi:hypothetical protein